MSAPAVTRPFSHLCGVRAFGWIGSVHQRNKRKIPRLRPQAAHVLRTGRAGVSGPEFVCVFQNGWFRAPLRSYLQVDTGYR